MWRNVLKVSLFFPAIFVVFYLIQYGVDVPFWDQWSTPAEDLLNFVSGNVTIENLFRQHNESRKFFPRIVFIALAQLGGWNVKQEMFLSLAVASLAYWSAYQLTRYTAGFQMTTVKLLGLLCIGLMIFSPMQYENWLWGIQVITFVPAAVTLGCSALAYSYRPSYIKFLVSAALCILATFSFANGLLTWVIVLPILTWFEYRSCENVRRTTLFVVGWSAVFLLNVYLYFRDYTKPSHHPSYTYAFEHPIQTISYFLSFIGSPLGLWDTWASFNFRIFLAIIFIVTYVIVSILCLQKSGGMRQAISNTIGWHTIAAYSISSAIVTSFGRVGFGVDQSTSGRYMTFSTYFYVGLIGLFITVLSLPQDSLSSSRNIDYLLKNWTKRLSIFSLIIFFVLYCLSFRTSLQISSMFLYQRRYAKACLLVFEEIQNYQCLDESVMPRKFLNNFLAFREANLRSFEPIITPSMQSLERKDSTEPADLGGISFFHGLETSSEVLETSQNGHYMTGGWINSSNRSEQIDAVILAYRDNTTQQDIGFWLAPLIPEHAIPNMVYDTINQDSERHGQIRGWQTELSTASLPPMACLISAWGFDADSRQVNRLKFEFSICLD